jgi:hypothetical protein
MKKAAVAPIQILKINNVESELTDDLLAVEEPMEIRIGFGKNKPRT